MEGAHTRIVLPDVSAKKRFVVPSVDVDDCLDVGPEDSDEAGNVITRDEVHVNRVPDFLAFVAHGKPLNMHGCVEAARRSVSRVTEVRKRHCHVFLGGPDPGQAPLKTLLLMLRLT